MKETLSAWIDSELDPRQTGTLLPRIKQDAELRRDWDCYHLIGDAVRGVHGPDLCARIRDRLDAEPTVLAPQRRSRAERLRWGALSLAASVAAAGFVGWIALSGRQPVPVQVASVSAPQVAAVSTPRVASVAAVAAPGVAVAIPASDVINDYLLAHQRYSPSDAMQGVAPYVLTVADIGSSAR
jgi:sigma-E factor negative regulatory protein RseA